MDCYILHTVLLVIILLFIIAIICYHYAELIKKIYCTKNTKIENNGFKKVDIKNRTYYSFDDIVKLEDFDFCNIFFTDEKSYKIIIHIKICLIRSYCVLGFTK